MANEFTKNTIKEFFHPTWPEGLSKKQVYSTIWKIFIPAVLEHALVQLVNMFDQMQVGYIGPAAISAVGLAGQVRSVLVTISFAMNIALTSLVSMSYGKGDREKMSNVITNGLFISGTISLLVTLLGWYIAEPMLVLFKAPDAQTLEYGIQYLRIILIGFFPLAITNSITAILRGVGNTKLPLYYNAGSNILNVFLNWVLINGNLGFKPMQVRGAAIATLISQCVAFVFALFVVTGKNNKLNFSFNRFFSRVKKNEILRIMKIGLPSMFAQGCSRFGIASYNAICASLGTELYASHVICTSIQLLTGMTGQSCEVVSTTMTGQSLGAKKENVAVLYTNCAMKICISLSFVLMAIYYFFGDILISFYNKTPSIIENGIVPLRIIAIMQPLVALQYVCAGTVKGSGETMYVSIFNLITKCLLRPILAYYIVSVMMKGLNGAWVAHCLAECICSLLVFGRYLSGKWLQNKNRIK